MGLLFNRVAENINELQKEDFDKEIASLKEENRRVVEQKFQLQTQAEEDKKINNELQEQLVQLTKHVKVHCKHKLLITQIKLKLNTTVWKIGNIHVIFLLAKSMFN